MSDARYPEGIDQMKFSPYGEDGDLFCVPEPVTDEQMVQGVIAFWIETSTWGDLSDLTEAHPVPWYENDEDKPDDVYHAEVIKAVTDEVDVQRTRGRFFEQCDPECPWGEAGGVSLAGADIDTDDPLYVPVAVIRFP